MKYSILVCAYNAEKYLKQCLDSLVHQTINKKEYEIILINDGSTDKTKEIASSYKNIKIINQKNKGLSESRNVALKHSSGTWILFVDADDLISTKLLEIIDTKKIQNKNFIIYKEIKEKLSLKKDKKRQSNKMDDSIVSRAIHKDLFLHYSFPNQKYKFAIEDWDFYVHNINKLKTLDITNEKDAYYFYRYNSNSLSKSSKVYRSRLEHAINIFENKKLRKNNLDNKIIGHYYEHLYMMSKLWFPNLLPRVKKIKYKNKISWIIKIQYWIVKLKIFNYFIKKTQTKIDE